MTVLVGLALVLLVQVGYSLGAVLATRKDISPQPRFLDIPIVIGICVVALVTRSALGKWAAIAGWFLVACLASYLLGRLYRFSPPPASLARIEARKHQGWRRLWNAWKGLAARMGNFQGRLLLSLFYFLVLAPWGVLVRIASDPLRIKRSAGGSFWIQRPGDSSGIDEARGQF